MTPVKDVIYMIDAGDGYLWPDDEPMSSMDSMALLLEFNQCRRSYSSGHICERRSQGANELLCPKGQ